MCLCIFTKYFNEIYLDKLPAVVSLTITKNNAAKKCDVFSNDKIQPVNVSDIELHFGCVHRVIAKKCVIKIVD